MSDLLVGHATWCGGRGGEGREHAAPVRAAGVSGCGGLPSSGVFEPSALGLGAACLTLQPPCRYTYTSMTRYYKHYTFNLHGDRYVTRTSSMSSYPGGHTAMPRSAHLVVAGDPGAPRCIWTPRSIPAANAAHANAPRPLATGMISSMDDFYILDSGLVVTETSNDVHDGNLWRLVKPQARFKPRQRARKGDGGAAGTGLAFTLTHTPSMPPGPAPAFPPSGHL